MFRQWGGGREKGGVGGQARRLPAPVFPLPGTNIGAACLYSDRVPISNHPHPFRTILTHFEPSSPPSNHPHPLTRSKDASTCIARRALIASLPLLTSAPPPPIPAHPAHHVPPALGAPALPVPS
eukprot:350015-Chlamydomonas_euryale.AAC.1